ncbi:MAG: TfoX/Sxy family protein [Spirochaetes bacterium]|nr:TfoX/Sxy family protein [Spirochaetota bacterium]
MAYSEELALRIRKFLAPQAAFIEKQMFGGVAFMVDDKMCVGISRDKVSGEDRLMARIGPGFHDEALKRTGCREMDFVGKPMTGFVFVHPDGYTNDADLLFWIEKTLEFNRQAPVKPVKKRALLAPKEKKTIAPPLKPAPKTQKKAATPTKKAVQAKAKPAKKNAKRK